MEAAGDDDSAEPIDHAEPNHDRFSCPVCGPLMLRVEAARGTVTPPVVTRPSASLIVVEGAFYAGTRPPTEPIRGAPIDLAEIAVSNDGVESIAFQVDPNIEYEVWATVQTQDADGVLNVPFDFVVGVERLDSIVHALAMAVEAERLRDELAPISFIEWVQALDRLNRVQGIQNEHRETIRRRAGNGEERQETGTERVLPDGTEPGGSGADEGGGPVLD